MDDAIGLREFHESPGAEDWRIVGDGGCAFFSTSGLDQAAEFVRVLAACPHRFFALPKRDADPFAR